MSVLFSKKIEDIVEKIDFSKIKGKVGIKVHFGEKGNKTYLRPEIAKAVYDKISSLGHEVDLIECNVLYRGSRTNREDHVKTAKEHGFGFATINILDGDFGDSAIELPVVNGTLERAKIGEGIKDYDSILVLSHFKGHVASGFGGAFKNLGMGLGSRSGKLHMHSDVSPSIEKELCTSCKVCVENCDFDAINIIEEKAEINSELCSGCAMCIAVCKFGAVKIPWGGSTNKQLQEKIVDYSKVIIDYLDENLFYINVLENITEDCDCVGKKMTPIVDDIGILSSSDPVALEKASLDLAGEKFAKINSVESEYMLEYAEKLGLGSGKYELVK